jgi:hypothetical protein
MYGHCWRCGQYQELDEKGSYCNGKLFEVTISTTCWLCGSTVGAVIIQCRK